MTKALPFTQASVRRRIRAAQSAGLRVVGISTDGTVITDEAIAMVGHSLENDPYAVAAERIHAKAARKRNGAAT